MLCARRHRRQDIDDSIQVIIPVELFFGNMPPKATKIHDTASIEAQRATTIKQASVFIEIDICISCSDILYRRHMRRLTT